MTRTENKKEEMGRLCETETCEVGTIELTSVLCSLHFKPEDITAVLPDHCIKCHNIY